MHQPVLLKEVLHYLHPGPNQKFIDCTLGDGGHAKAILENTKPHGTLLGIDRDPQMLKRAQQNLRQYRDRITFVHGTFANLERIALRHGFIPVQGIVFDLGVSLWHFTEARRGFSFRDDTVLDMRFDPGDFVAVPASYIIAHADEKELHDIFVRYGNERAASRIARRIVSERRQKPIRTAQDLALLVERATGTQRRPSTHPATRIFQALRIAVNHEYEHLERGLAAAQTLLAPRARIVIIAFHSGEDKIVKEYFKERTRDGIFMPVTKKPIIPSKKERLANPRSRSAKLRVAERQ